MNESHPRLKGIIPALITPYTDEGQINELVTRRLVRHLISEGVSGLYVCGSTGESFLQTADERKQLLEIVMDEVGGQVAVLSHVGAMDTATSVQLAQHAAAVGVDAISAVTPFYYKHGAKEIKRHYLEIATAASLPFIAYHIPGLTGTRNTADFYGELSRSDEVIGVKFTHTDMYDMQQILDLCGEQFLVFNGVDECCIAGLATGACGAIGSTFNIMPNKFVEMYRLFVQGNVAEARRIQFEVNRLMREIDQYDFIAYEKEVLRLQGFEVGNPRKPLQQLSEHQRLNIESTAKNFAFLGI